MNALLDVQHLKVTFTQYERGLRRREVTALADMSVRVGPGELVALVGASGAGKSLLGHAVLGILPPNATESGTVSYDGRTLSPPDRRALAGRGIALLPQSVTFLDPTATAGAQVRRAAQLAGLPDPRSAAADALAARGLEPSVAATYPHQLSGGMARRVLAAIALIGTPRLVIADEPTPGLPADDVARTLAGLREIARGDRGVLLITHDLVGALEVADRVVVCDAGRTIEEAPVTAFAGDGEALAHPYSRSLWLALPRNRMVVTC